MTNLTPRTPHFIPCHILLLLLLFVLPCSAQQPFVERYNMSVLDMRNGLPNNHIDALFTDSYGFMWIASQGGGLLRYDGYTFFSPTVHNMGFAPRSNSCRAIAEDRFHRLWVSYEEGTDIIDLRLMRKLSAPSSDISPELDTLLNQPAVRCHCDSRGNMWVVTRSDIHYIPFDDDGHPQKILRYRYAINNVPDIMVRDVEQNGSVWATVDGGLCRLSPQGERLVRSEIAAPLTKLPTSYVSDFLRQDDFIWVTTVDGLFRYDMRSYQLHHYVSAISPHSSTPTAQSPLSTPHVPLHTSYLSHNAATCLMLMPDGTLLVGTLCGLNVYSPATDTFEYITASSPVPLSSDYVKQITLLGQQLWIATETGGITRMNPRQLQLRNYCHIPDDATSLSPNAVNAMYIAPDGTLWVGTVEGGLNRQNPHDSRFTHLTTSNSALSHNSVSTLVADNLNRLWVGTWGGGICLVDMQSGLLRRFTMGDDFDRTTAYIGALAFDPFNNGLWIGSNDGLYYYDFAKEQVIEPFEGCRNVRGCVGALISQSGELWMGCLEGARVISLKKRDAQGRFPCRALRYRLDDPESRVIEKISCICQAHDGTLWLGSNEYGLYHRTLDEQGQEQFVRYTQQQGLANDAVKGIVEDAQGQIWITTNNGLSLLNPATGLFANYDTDDGLLSSQFYWNSAVKGPDGQLYLGSVRGLTILTPHSSLLTSHPSQLTPSAQLRFTHLTVDNLDVTAESRHLDEDISQARLLRLHESDKSFVLSFSALTYANTHQGTYSYRLRGFDDRWAQLPAGEHSVRYTSLPPGSYTLEVRYVSPLAPQPSLLTLDIHVTPYFWHSWWFICLLLFLLTVAGSWLYRLRMQRLSERIKKEEEQRLMAPIEKAVRESRDPEQMQARIQEILHIQQRIEESTNKTAEASDVEARQREVPFMERVMAIMEANYKNSEFGVQQMCEAMGMSRSLLSKRLNAETGLPTSQFIRHYRLNIAHELLLRKRSAPKDASLAKSELRNVADIAFSVGFNDPKYFTRCFHRQYGIAPSSLLFSSEQTESPIKES